MQTGPSNGNTGAREEQKGSGGGREGTPRYTELTYLVQSEPILALIQFDGIHELLRSTTCVHEAFREHVRGENGVSTGRQGCVPGGSKGSGRRALLSVTGMRADLAPHLILLYRQLPDHVD